MSTPRLAAVSVVVTDMAAAMGFYRACGLDAPDDVADAPHAEIALDGVTLMFDTVATVRSFDPGWEPPSGGHRVALALGCASPHEVDARYRSVVGAGFDGHLAPFDAPWGQRYAVLRDPDGTAVDLCAALPSAG